MKRRFEPVEWIYTTNIYEVNLRQYTKEGTFIAFSMELPRLKDMGVETLWFMPITPISFEKRQGTAGSYYACSDYTSTNPEFGTLEDFKQLVAKAHKLGMKVIIDWVANHTGWDHKWTQSNPGFYKKNAAGEFYDSNEWKDVIDLNYYDHAMRREMIASMRFWVDECSIDGFRCDMAHLVPLDFWRDARVSLDTIRPLFWLAETEHPNYMEVFDCCYSWNWMHQTEKFSKHEIDFDHLIDSLIKTKDRFPPGTLHMYFTSNHDENSWTGTEYEKYGFLVKPLTVLNSTWTGIPLVYSGQEIPNKRRLKFFEKDPIEWTGKNELHHFFKTLFTIRKTNPAIQAGYDRAETVVLNMLAEKVFGYTRRVSERKIIVLLNFAAEQRLIPLNNLELEEGKFTNVFTGESVDLSIEKEFVLEGGGYLILEN